MSSSKNNVNPNFYKTAGRESLGQDINQKIHKQKYAESQAKFNSTEENESASEFIPGSTSLPDLSNSSMTEKDAGQNIEQDKSSNNVKKKVMNKQQSQMKEKQIAEDQTYSTVDGFETSPTSEQVNGASGGTETTGRTAIEVEDYYTAEEMHEQAEEADNTANSSATRKGDAFNPVLNSLSEVTEK